MDGEDGEGYGDDEEEVRLYIYIYICYVCVCAYIIIYIYKRTWAAWTERTARATATTRRRCDMYIER